MFKFFAFALLLSPLVLPAQATIIEVECEYGDEYFDYSFLSNIQLIVCAVNDVVVSDNVTKLLIVEDEEDFNSISITQSRMHTFPSELFEQIPTLKYINVYKVEMKEIEDDAFANASSLIFLNIFFNELSDIRENTFRGVSTLKTLTLSHNQIKSIHPKAFAMLQTLEFVDIANNLLETFDPETFSSLINLKHLYLSECRIKVVPVTAFIQNVNLLTLHLDGNSLEKNFELDITSNNLKGFNLNLNNLTKVILHQKSSNATIRHINLNFNKIEEIDIDASLNIKVLKLSGNKMTSLQSILPHVTLKFLQLSNSPFTDLTNIDKLSRLTRLYLDRTKAVLKPGIFESLSNLKSLHLTKMSLSKLDVAWLRGLSNLGMLNVGHNQLQELNYKDLASELPSLRSVMINENSFNCSFLEEMLTYWKNDTSIKVLDADTENTTMNVDNILCNNGSESVDESHFLRSLFITIAVLVGIGLIMFVLMNVAKKYEWDLPTYMNYRSYSNMTNSGNSRLVNEDQ